MRATKGFFVVTLVALAARGAATVACGGSTPAPKACDQTCVDNVAAHSVRDAMKLSFNLLLAGREVGDMLDTMVQKCPLGGTVQITGSAQSNAEQGATFVHLTYVFDRCVNTQKLTNAEQTYSLTITGTVKEDGTISVQPSSTTALSISSAAITLTGTVHDPPIAYDGEACAMTLQQNGGNLNGTLCTRPVGLTL